jgi:stage III sporulation protein AG
MKERLQEIIGKNKYVILVLILGVTLLLLPTGGDSDESEKTEYAETEYFSLEKTEERLEAILSKIEGAGEVSVLLTVKSDGERLLAQDMDIQETGDESSRENSSVVFEKKDGDSLSVVTQYIYPEYIGAVVVAQGADSSKVKLSITEAVMASTGLSSDKIKVLKMK